ncbi:MAG: response regulator [Xanthomonadales bacterium]|nr:response regulator [Xanthomonadales bacterium]
MSSAPPPPSRKSGAEARESALFTAALTHAFRSRLNAVLGSMELVSQTRLQEDQARFVSTAVNEGRALLQLLNDALDLGRIAAGEVQIADVPLDPVAIAEGALGSVAAQLHARGLGAICVIDPQTPVQLRGDAARLRQILVNLLDNACKATTSGSVKLRVWPDPEDRRGCHLYFEVSDTGPGVPDAMRERLFEPFVPAGGRADWRMTSLGLGLALCRGLVERMGGKIEYEERRGGGSVFRFDAQLQRDTEFERLADWVAEARERRMLLVDSDSTRRVAFAEQARAWGIKVRVTPDGDAALPLLRAGSFDLLLVHQDAQGAAALLAAVRTQRSAILVPSGATPRLELASAGASLLWLSAPLRSRTLLDALLGREVASLEVAALPHDTAGDTRPRVLVVEDSEANRMVMSAQLDRLGCTVDAVETGSEAVRLVSQRAYGLVFMDLSLPDMSGLEVAAAIRRRSGDTARVPIVAVTGGVHPQDRERCLAAGMNGYLSKPVNRQDLQRVLERYLPRSTLVKAWDPAVIEQMGESFGMGRAVDLLTAFQRELGQRLGRIREHADLTPIGNEAHALKSAALSFGAEPLGDLARDLEEHCRAGRSAQVQECRRQLLLLGQSALRAIGDWIERHREQT